MGQGVRVGLGLLVAGTALSAVALGLASADAAPGRAGESARAAVRAAAPSDAPRASPRAQLLKDFDPRTRQLSGARYETTLGGDRRAVLTLDPGLDQHVSGLLTRYQVPRAGVVALDPKTGKLLAYVSHSQTAGDDTDYVLDPSPPAASVFKVVTGAALLEHGVQPATTTCYHGGASGLTAYELKDDPKLDTACVSLTSALGGSVNAVFGKLALKHLDAKTLERYADAFGFGQRLPFDVTTLPSAIDVPQERVEFARTAAGFWHMHMSPLHGALIAATIANGGRMMRPYVVERVEDAQGRVLQRSEPDAFRDVLGRQTAALLAEMMEATVTRGTAKKTFFDDQGHAFLPGIKVAGKTGTLSEEQPYRGYTWWIGFAPADEPALAVAALVVNSPKWRIKATYVGREAMRYYLVERPRQKAGEPAKR